jgi:hypothetical protein
MLQISPKIPVKAAFYLSGLESNLAWQACQQLASLLSPKLAATRNNFVTVYSGQLCAGNTSHPSAYLRMYYKADGKIKPPF